MVNEQNRIKCVVKYNLRVSFALRKDKSANANQSLND